MVAAACERATARGYRDIKLHEITVPEVRAARQAIGPDARLMVDTNCPWTVRQAIDTAHRLREFDLTWLEEPVSPPGDHAGLARVRRECGVPKPARMPPACTTSSPSSMPALLTWRSPA